MEDRARNRGRNQHSTDLSLIGGTNKKYLFYPNATHYCVAFVFLPEAVYLLVITMHPLRNRWVGRREVYVAKNVRFGFAVYDVK